MGLSLVVGFLMLGGKAAAYGITGSTAVLSDAAESVIHVAAVSFAAFSLWLSGRPADHRFRYGYERISFFSAGFEGALIALAALVILVEVVRKWRAGLQFTNLSSGVTLVLVAALLNAGLGWYLLRVGRRNRSIILEANGKHVLADSWTSFGVVGGLLLVLWTGWKPFDPLCAIAVALNILWSGGRLVWSSFSGLMDYADPTMGQALRDRLNEVCEAAGVSFHGVRYRSTGYRTLVEVHLLFPYDVPLGEAHRIATEIEARLPEGLDTPLEVITHLEAVEDHGRIHREETHYTEV
jgi:cation diffusion facilitator family transporter